MVFGKSVELRSSFTLHFCLPFHALLPWFIELSTVGQMFDDSGRDSDVSGKDMAIHGCPRRLSVASWIDSQVCYTLLKPN